MLLSLGRLLSFLSTFWMGWHSQQLSGAIVFMRKWSSRCLVAIALLGLPSFMSKLSQFWPHKKKFVLAHLKQSLNIVVLSVHFGTLVGRRTFFHILWSRITSPFRLALGQFWERYGRLFFYKRLKRPASSKIVRSPLPEFLKLWFDNGLALTANNWAWRILLFGQRGLVCSINRT